jgi:hypothetical protein
MDDVSFLNNNQLEDRSLSLVQLPEKIPSKNKMSKHPKLFFLRRGLVLRLHLVHPLHFHVDQLGSKFQLFRLHVNGACSRRNNIPIE